jgi:two-component system, NarL family, response regulator NreC
MANIEPVQILASGKTRLFLADDHALVRGGLVALLEKTGEFEVVGQCGDGLGVVQQVIDTRPDVVVLDVGMPGLTGVEVCHVLNRKLPGVVVLMLSMHAEESFIIRALENGARGYLLKESAAAHLLKALKTAMAGAIYLDPAIDKGVLARLHQPRKDAYDTLTPRERQVLQLIVEGLTNRKIAERLGLSIKTVDTHRARLMNKLDISDLTTLVKFYLKRNGGLMA